MSDRKNYSNTKIIWDYDDVLRATSKCYPHYPVGHFGSTKYTGR